MGLELLRAIRHSSDRLAFNFWRDPDGPEVDWIVAGSYRWLPVEVKWAEAPTKRDARHLETFLAEHPKARDAVVVCRTPRRFKLGVKVTAVPWQEIPELVAEMA